MPTLVSRAGSSGASDVATGTSSSVAAAAGGAPSISSLVAQAAAVERVRSRFFTAAGRAASSPLPAAGAAVGSLDDALSALGDDDHTDALSSASSAPAPAPLSPQETLEAEFAAAVVFVDTYQGPHRILRQDNSAPKKDFYALYQQATVGACPLVAPPPGASKLEAARWEKWRALGRLPRHEAMRRYTETLDNLVDDWRRSAGLSRLVVPSPPAAANLSSSMISNASSGGGGVGGASIGSPRPAHYRAGSSKKPLNMFERLPRIYDEFADLQERVEDETRKREELEAQLAAFTQDNRTLFSRELRQVDAMRSSLTQLVQSLEEDVAQHYNELQLAQQRAQQLQAVVDGSLVLRVETRVRQVYAVAAAWVANKTVRRVLLLLVVIRAWRFLRQRRMPQFLAQLLIRWITTVSSLEGSSTATASGTIVRR